MTAVPSNLFIMISLKVDDSLKLYHRKHTVLVYVNTNKYITSFCPGSNVYIYIVRQYVLLS